MTVCSTEQITFPNEKDIASGTWPRYNGTTVAAIKMSFNRANTVYLISLSLRISRQNDENKVFRDNIKLRVSTTLDEIVCNSRNGMGGVGSLRGFLAKANRSVNPFVTVDKISVTA